MKYIGKISSVLLTVAFVLAIVFANNNKNEIRGSKSSTVQQFQEKNQPDFAQKKRESVEVVYDKEEESIAQEINKPTETEINLPSSLTIIGSEILPMLYLESPLTMSFQNLYLIHI